jgi:hypothetical protein
VSATCREEAQDLLALAEPLTDAVPRIGDALSRWRAALLSLLEGPEVETLAGEQKLDALTAALRETWLRAAHSYSNPQWKSPPHALKRALPGGGSISYNYERALRPTSIETRLAAFRPAPPGWDEAHLVFASGMAAISTLLQAHLRLARPRTGDPTMLAALWGGYFETYILLDTLRGPGFGWFRPATQAELAEATSKGAYDVLIAEPVTYDWDLAVLDLDLLRDAWAQRSASPRPGAIVLDTTLSGDELSHTRLLETFGDSPPALVAVVSSGSKLDQQGLELTNVGLLSLFTPAGATRPAGDIARYLEKLRSSFGTGLSLDELVVLEAPFFLDRAGSTRFARAVFESNAILARRVTRLGGLFASLNHPARRPEDGCPWAVGPFVVFDLRQEAPEHHRLLLAVVQEEARRRGLSLTLGSSFGFRGHRFEAIQPEPMGSKGLFKVALGARGGPSREGIVELFDTLSSYPDIQALRRTFSPAIPARAPTAPR